jgi:Fungal specific transcription factor domain
MIRQCLQLGFHRQLKADDRSTELDEFKKRLFWSTYHLERRISLVLGRPLAINDDEIDIDFPQYIEEDDDDDRSKPRDKSLEKSMINSRSTLGPHSTPGQAELSFHALVLTLDQLNSKSRLTLCRLSKANPVAKIERKIAKRFQKLEDWKTGIFGSHAENDPKESTELMYFTSRTPVQTPQSRPARPEAQRLTLMLNYHRARRLILQTILTDIERPNHTFPYASFAKSSGEVCQLNRRLHRLKPVPFTLLDLHSVFVAGLSMIYCVWKDPQLYNVEMAADFGACSTLLYLIAEQWGAGAKKYRDAFELGAERTAEYVQSIKQFGEERQQPAFAEQHGQVDGANYEDASGNMHNGNNTYGMDTTGGWPSDNFDVWQMMTQAVQTHDTQMERDALHFTGIEEFMVEEAMWWFSEGTYTGASVS